MIFDDLRNPKLIRYRMILSEIEGERILDLGSAKGGLHEFLLRNSKSKFIGIDIKKSQNTDVIADLNGGFPLKSSSVHTVIAGELLPYIIEPYYFLKECHRVIKPNGKLIITVPNSRGLQFIIGHDYPDQIYGWTMPFFVRLIESAGFKVEKTAFLNASFWSANPAFRVICELIRSIKPVLFVSCRKLEKSKTLSKNK